MAAAVAAAEGSPCVLFRVQPVPLWASQHRATTRRARTTRPSDSITGVGRGLRTARPRVRTVRLAISLVGTAWLAVTVFDRRDPGRLNVSEAMTRLVSPALHLLLVSQQVGQ